MWAQKPQLKKSGLCQFFFVAAESRVKQSWNCRRCHIAKIIARLRSRIVGDTETLAEAFLSIREGSLDGKLAKVYKKRLHFDAKHA